MIGSRKENVGCAARTRKVRFVLAWQTYRVGDVIEPNGVLREWLIANKYAVPVEGAEAPREAELPLLTRGPGRARR